MPLSGLVREQECLGGTLINCGIMQQPGYAGNSAWTSRGWFWATRARVLPKSMPKQTGRRPPTSWDGPAEDGGRNNLIGGAVTRTLRVGLALIVRSLLTERPVPYVLADHRLGRILDLMKNEVTRIPGAI